MSIPKFENISRLMATYNFEFKELPDNLKCVKCKLVLKDACIVPCGCTFCRICIDDMKKRDNEFCTGVTDICKTSALSSSQSDYRASMSISLLTVKCPHEGCVHECQLTNMESHLGECQRKNEQCPFRELGCTHDELGLEEITKHLQDDHCRHSKLLIGMINEIRNEVKSNREEIKMLKKSNEDNTRDIAALKQKDEDNTREIAVLKQKDEDNISIIENLNQGLLLKDQDRICDNENLKLEMLEPKDKNMVNQMDLQKNLTAKEYFDDRSSISSVETEPELDEQGLIDAVEVVITKFMNKFEVEIASIKEDILKINQNIQSIENDICSVKSQVRSIQALVGLVDARCELVIDDDVAEKSWKLGDTASDHVTGAAYPYKYRLSLCNSDGSLQIYLRIHSGPNDGHLAWPFDGRVAITVAEKDRRETCRSISRQCRIRKPPDNYYSSSDKFDFSHSVLIGAGLDLSRGVCVSCVIVPDAGR